MRRLDMTLWLLAVLPLAGALEVSYTPPTTTPQVNVFSTQGCVVGGGSIGDLFSGIANTVGHECSGPNRYTYPDGEFDLYIQASYTVNLPDYDIIAHVRFWTDDKCTSPFGIWSGANNKLDMSYGGCLTNPTKLTYGAMSFSVVNAGTPNVIGPPGLVLLALAAIATRLAGSFTH